MCSSGAFAGRIMITNVFLAGFNLLPGIPDGWRPGAPGAARHEDGVHASDPASGADWSGHGNPVGFVGLQGNPMLIFIALFVWIGAGQEASMVQMKSSLAGIPVRRAMLTDFHTLTPVNTLGDAVNLMLTGSQQDFPVVHDGRIEGILTRSDLLKALTRNGRVSRRATTVWNVTARPRTRRRCWTPCSHGHEAANVTPYPSPNTARWLAC